eukprot:TRINITY_DN36375_c0_g2_i1.p1 TRINITY_DN36375_c0_g2~~TRINITY_DN36375_c0_g2_i1.p1  ORF type:complete len:130 (+),score=36.24 TRINITY_DN36375_c0_g2_i1:21-410(+)
MHMSMTQGLPRPSWSVESAEAMKALKRDFSGYQTSEDFSTIADEVEGMIDYETGSDAGSEDSSLAKTVMCAPSPTVLPSDFSSSGHSTRSTDTGNFEESMARFNALGVSMIAGFLTPVARKSSVSSSPN